MYRKWLTWIGAATLALAVVLLSAAPASAQRWGYGHGFYGPTYGYGYGDAYGSGVYANRGFGYGYYPGWRANWGYYPGSNYGWGTTWNGYPTTTYTYAPSDYGTGQVAASNTMPAGQYTSFYSAASNYSESQVPRTAALFHVQVAPDAKITFSGHETKETGHHREFVTPALEENQVFYYNIRAQWTDNGRNIDRTNKILVRPGDRIRIDFDRDITVVEEMIPSRTMLRSQSGYEGTADQNLRREGELVPAPADRDDLNRAKPNRNGEIVPAPADKADQNRSDVNRKDKEATAPNNNDDLNKPAPSTPAPDNQSNAPQGTTPQTNPPPTPPSNPK